MRRIAQTFGLACVLAVCGALITVNQDRLSSNPVAAVAGHFLTGDAGAVNPLDDFLGHNALGNVVWNGDDGSASDDDDHDPIVGEIGEIINPLTGERIKIFVTRDGRIIYEPGFYLCIWCGDPVPGGMLLTYTRAGLDLYEPISGPATDPNPPAAEGAPGAGGEVDEGTATNGYDNNGDGAEDSSGDNPCYGNQVDINGDPIPEGVFPLGLLIFLQRLGRRFYVRLRKKRGLVVAVAAAGGLAVTGASTAQASRAISPMYGFQPVAWIGAKHDAVLKKPAATVTHHARVVVAAKTSRRK